MKPETIKILNNGKGGNFPDISHSNIFPDLSPESRERKKKSIVITTTTTRTTLAQNLTRSTEIKTTY